MIALTSHGRFRAFVLVVAALTALAVGCTLLGSRDLVQCASNAECPLDPRMCVDGLCALKTAANTTSHDGAADAAVACTSTMECDQTVASVCIDHACTPLTSDVCPYVTTNGVGAASDLHSKDTVLVASYTNLGNSPTADSAAVTIQRAVTQLHGKLTSARPVVLYCKKDGGGPTRLNDVLSHLVSRGVPAIFGQFETTELNTVTADTKSKIAIWSTLGNTDALQGSNQGGSKNLWFFLDQLTRLSDGFQKAFDRAADLANPGRANTHVAIITDDSTEAAEVDALAASLPSKLTENGSTLLSTNVEIHGVEYAATLPQTFAPQVVIGIGGDSILTDVVNLIESNASITPKPAYVLTSRARYPYQTLNGLVIKNTGSVKYRLMGVDFSGDREQWLSYVNAANQLGQGAAPFDQLFDATYATAFIGIRARQIAGDAPITVDTMTSALGILVPADPASASTYKAVGTTNVDFNSAVSSATSGTPFILSGNTGPWTFDAAARTRKMGTSFFCIKDSAVTTYLEISAADSQCDKKPNQL